MNVITIYWKHRSENNLSRTWTVILIIHNASFKLFKFSKNRTMQMLRYFH